MPNHSLLIVDDEAGLVGFYFEGALSGLADFEVLTATGVKEAMAICEKRPNIDVVLLDVCFHGEAEGLGALPAMRALLPEAEIIVFTQIDDPPVEEAMKLGASKLFSKHHYGADEITVKVTEAIGRMVRRKHLREEAGNLAAEVGAVFVSKAMTQVFSEAYEARSQEASVLITGPTGSGKELVAKAIGEIPGKPYVAHSCANIEDSLIESKLFGHERGAFTDAKERHIGLFEQAHGGTLFLDEVGTLSKRAQEALLRVLETGEFMRVGGKTIIKVDVRVISATNEDLETRIASGEFREDLYQRLAARRIIVPSLQSRKEDIAPLIEAFLRRYAPAGTTMDRLCISLLEKQSWPRNVRQLLDTVLYMIHHSGGFSLDSSDVPQHVLDASLVHRSGAVLAGHSASSESLIFRAPWGQKLSTVVGDFEKTYILATLQRLGSEASARQLARTLKTPDTTFKRHLTRLGMTELASFFHDAPLKMASVAPSDAGG